MKFLKKALAPKELKAAFGVLDEAAYRFQTRAFQIVKTAIETSLLTDPEGFINALKRSSGRSPRDWVYSQIGNVAGDMLESGEYHIYRGVLNPVGPGQNLLALFDASYDELLQLKAVTLDYANKQKSALRENIKEMG